MERRLLREVMRANKQWHLIEPDDRVMVCLSGGKDSYALLALLQKLQTIVPFRFSLVPACRVMMVEIPLFVRWHSAPKTMWLCMPVK